MDKFVIRRSVKEDCGQIMDMIRELADVENMLDQVKMTTAILERDGGFDDTRPYYFAFVAENTATKKVVAYAMFVFHYSVRHGKSIHLEDLFVREECRRVGIGSRLMSAVALFGRENQCKGLHLHCLEWNVGPMKMYKRRGAVNITEHEDWHVLRFNSEEFKQQFLTV